jgi:hypothetical protein
MTATVRTRQAVVTVAEEIRRTCELHLKDGTEPPPQWFLKKVEALADCVRHLAEVEGTS